MKGRKLKIEVVILMWALLFGTMFVSCGGPSNHELRELQAENKVLRRILLIEIIAIDIVLASLAVAKLIGYDLQNLIL